MTPDDEPRPPMSRGSLHAALYVALFIIAIMLGCWYTESRKATQQAAPPTTIPGNNFAKGSRMMPGAEGLVVRSACTLSVAGTQLAAFSVLGTVTGPAVMADGYWWWPVVMDGGTGAGGCGRDQFMVPSNKVAAGLPLTMQFTHDGVNASEFRCYMDSMIVAIIPAPQRYCEYLGAAPGAHRAEVSAANVGVSVDGIKYNLESNKAFVLFDALGPPAQTPATPTNPTIRNIDAPPFPQVEFETGSGK